MKYIFTSLASLLLFLLLMPTGAAARHQPTARLSLGARFGWTGALNGATLEWEGANAAIEMVIGYSSNGYRRFVLPPSLKGNTGVQFSIKKHLFRKFGDGSARFYACASAAVKVHHISFRPEVTGYKGIPLHPDMRAGMGFTCDGGRLINLFVQLDVAVTHNGLAGYRTMLESAAGVRVYLMRPV